MNLVMRRRSSETKVAKGGIWPQKGRSRREKQEKRLQKMKNMPSGVKGKSTKPYQVTENATSTTCKKTSYCLCLGWLRIRWSSRSWRTPCWKPRSPWPVTVTTKIWTACWGSRRGTGIPWLPCFGGKRKKAQKHKVWNILQVFVLFFFFYSSDGKIWALVLQVQQISQLQFYMIHLKFSYCFQTNLATMDLRHPQTVSTFLPVTVGMEWTGTVEEKPHGMLLVNFSALLQCFSFAVVMITVLGIFTM